MGYRHHIIFRDRCIDMGHGAGLNAADALDDFAWYVDTHHPNMTERAVPSRANDEASIMSAWYVWRRDVPAWLSPPRTVVEPEA